MHPVWDLPLQPAGVVIELANGGRVRIRPVRPNDRDALHAAWQRLSEESRYMRFFSARSQLSEQLATTLTEIDHKTHFAWAVFDPDQPSEVEDDSGLAVGVARLILDKPSEDHQVISAEAALTVVDDFQGRGIGRFLIELLAATAAGVGAEVLRFEILRQNRAMIGLIAGMGASSFPIEGDRSVIEYRLTVPPIEDVAVPAGALYELLRHVAKNAENGE